VIRVPTYGQKWWVKQSLKNGTGKLGIDQFDVELELTKWIGVELEKWN